MKLYVVRHGVTVWNKLHRLQGSADIPLADGGIRLAEKVGEALKDIPFDICFTSPLMRARRTAELILEKQTAKIPVIEDKRIQEISFGIWEGETCMDDDGNYLNPALEKFFQDPWHYERPQDGENIADILSRTGEFWKEKTADPSLQEKTILIASHGCAVRALLQNVYQEPENFWHGCVPPNCSVNIVEVKNGKAVFLEEDKVYA